MCHQTLSEACVNDAVYTFQEGIIWKMESYQFAHRDSPLETLSKCWRNQNFSTTNQKYFWKIFVWKIFVEHENLRSWVYRPTTFLLKLCQFIQRFFITVSKWKSWLFMNNEHPNHQLDCQIVNKKKLLKNGQDLAQITNSTIKLFVFLLSNCNQKVVREWLRLAQNGSSHCCSSGVSPPTGAGSIGCRRSTAPSNFSQVFLVLVSIVMVEADSDLVRFPNPLYDFQVSWRIWLTLIPRGRVTPPVSLHQFLASVSSFSLYSHGWGWLWGRVTPPVSLHRLAVCSPSVGPVCQRPPIPRE